MIVIVNQQTDEDIEIARDKWDEYTRMKFDGAISDAVYRITSMDWVLEPRDETKESKEIEPQTN